MQKSVKAVLVSLSVSALIVGGSLPLMAAETPKTIRVEDNKGGKKCAGMKKGTSEVKDNKGGMNCSGMKQSVPKEKTVKGVEK
jgi:hypothetical protein